MEISARELVEQLPIERSAPSHVRRMLTPAHCVLIASGYLANAEFVEQPRPGKKRTDLWVRYTFGKAPDPIRYMFFGHNASPGTWKGARRASAYHALEHDVQLPRRHADGAVHEPMRTNTGATAAAAPVFVLIGVGRASPHDRHLAGVHLPLLPLAAAKDLRDHLPEARPAADRRLHHEDGRLHRVRRARELEEVGELRLFTIDGILHVHLLLCGGCRAESSG